MKNLIIATLSTSILAWLAPSTPAQQIYLFNSSRYQNVKESLPVQPQTSQQTQITTRNSVVDSNSEKITPVTLVKLGYQGYFVEQGIPSNGLFNFAVKTGKVDAQKLVQSAIDKGRLPSDSINDQVYLDAIQSQLRTHNRL